MKILKEIKNSPFKPPKKKYYFGRIIHGTPYFIPMRFNSTIFSFRKLTVKSETELEEYDKIYPYHKKYKNDERRFKNIPSVRRCKDYIFTLFGSYYWLSVGYPICIHSSDLGWKDKFDSPRHEWNPAFYIFFFKWQFCIWWTSPNGYSDRYYEQVLWYLYYSDKDIVKAENTWMWVDIKTELSTWDKNYLK